LDTFFNNLNNISTSQNSHVRAIVAESLYNIAEKLNKDSVIDKLLPICLQMLRDENNLVRLVVIQELTKFDKILGPDILDSKISPTLWDMTQDKNWRVRLEIIKYLPKICDHLGQQFISKLQLELIYWLEDIVSEIRDNVNIIICEFIGK